MRRKLVVFPGSDHGPRVSRCVEFLGSYRALRKTTNGLHENLQLQVGSWKDLPFCAHFRFLFETFQNVQREVLMIHNECSLSKPFPALSVVLKQRLKAKPIPLGVTSEHSGEPPEAHLVPFEPQERAKQQRASGNQGVMGHSLRYPNMLRTSVPGMSMGRDM